MSTPPLPTLTDTLAPISDALDALSHEQRVNWMRGLPSRDMAALYALASQGGPLGLDHFTGKEGEVIIHWGQNSLPAFSVFQKRIVRQGDVVQGYNHQTMSWITGPGHFTLQQNAEGVYFDYTTHPPTSHPEFPPLRDNMAGFSRFVYGGTIDKCRRVSQHAIIGAAFRANKPLGAYFMLVRETLPG